MKRVVITGGSGFVGANLARRLFNDGHELHLLVRPGYKHWRIQSIQSHVQLHQVPLGDREALDRVVSEIKPDWIFHLAAHGAYSWQSDLHQMLQTNVIETINLVQACLKIGFEAFVNTGSSSEYGYKDHAPPETEWLEPNSHYAVTKASATMFCRYAAQSRGVHITTLRLYSVYGPYEDPKRLIPTLILRGLKGELPPLGSPEVARDYVYVSDVNEAYVLAATRRTQEPGAVYNVGTEVQTSLRELVEIARRILNISAKPAWGSMPNRAWDTSVWVANNRKLRDELGWTPRYSVEEGLKETAQWFKDNPELLAFYSQVLQQKRE